MRVPLDYDAPDGKQIFVSVARLPATDRTHRQERCVRQLRRTWRCRRRRDQELHRRLAPGAQRPIRHVRDGPARSRPKSACDLVRRAEAAAWRGAMRPP